NCQRDHCAHDSGKWSNHGKQMRYFSSTEPECGSLSRSVSQVRTEPVESYDRFRTSSRHVRKYSSFVARIFRLQLLNQIARLLAHLRAFRTRHRRPVGVPSVPHVHEL